MLVLQCAFYRIWGHSGAIKGFCLVWTLHTHLRRTRLLSPASLFLITSTAMHCNWSIMSHELSSACPRRALEKPSCKAERRPYMSNVMPQSEGSSPVWISLLTCPSVWDLIPSHQGRWTTCPTQPQDEKLPNHFKFYSIRKSVFFFFFRFSRWYFQRSASEQNGQCLHKLVHMFFWVT